MQDVRARRIAFEGAANFRDIGGYPAAGGRRVRWGRVFRSDSLSKLTDGDLRRLAELGLRTLVDFRVPAERAEQPDRLHPDHTIETNAIGLLPAGTLDMLRAVSAGTIDGAAVERAFLEQYRRFVTDHAAEFARALAAIGDERNLPLLLHCTSGKDRTGFAVAALLLALGTPQDVVLDDYALTNSYMRDITDYFAPSAPPALVRAVMTAQAQYLHAALDQMRASFGSIDAYLERALGLDDRRRARLAALLTEPA